MLASRMGSHPLPPGLAFGAWVREGLLSLPGMQRASTFAGGAWGFRPLIWGGREHRENKAESEQEEREAARAGVWGPVGLSPGSQP